MSHYRVIAIDGPAASGKSSVGRLLARKLGCVFVSSGTMYRAATWYVQRSGIAIDDDAAIVACLPRLRMDFLRRENELVVRVNGEEPGDELTSETVNSGVSYVSRIPEVRELLTAKQRACADTGDLVMEGRDIGSVVFPDTPHKFYLDASEAVRAQRRAAEGVGGDTIAARDRIDSTRKTAPLVVADGAEVIDTSTLDLEEVVAVILQKLQSC